MKIKSVRLVAVITALLLSCGSPLRAADKPVRVFILAGQSNMQGQGYIAANPKRNDGKGCLEFLVKDPATAARFKHLVGGDGKWVVRDDVWISYLDRKGPLTVGYGATPELIGPELGFGTVVGDAIDEPVLLIKCAWGGKSLAVDFRPPSSGKIPYSTGAKGDAEIQKDPAIVGKYYRETLALTKESLGKLNELVPGSQDRGYVLAGFGWHQGWNDRINQRFNDEYEKNLANFIRDIRKDLGVPALPFVIAETGMNGPDEKNPRALSLMKAQAAVAEQAEFKENVAFVGTRSFWRAKELSPSSQGYHWNTNAETYYIIGEAMGRAMLQLQPGVGYEVRHIDGWTVRISLALMKTQKSATESTLVLLDKQLAEIVRVVPAEAVAKLREVPLWFSPEYPGIPPRAEYHPDAGWLRENGRNPEMARGVEFTDVRNFDREMIRMPNFVLHELAHSYHHRFLTFEQSDIIAAYQRAKESKSYDKVERFNGNGQPNTFARAYGMTNEKEYFAESTEAFFGRNDFFPFTRDELKKHDPVMHDLLARLWGVGR
jgi:hypothetical protein